MPWKPSMTTFTYKHPCASIYTCALNLKIWILRLTVKLLHTSANSRFYIKKNNYFIKWTSNTHTNQSCWSSGSITGYKLQPTFFRLTEDLLLLLNSSASIKGLFKIPPYRRFLAEVVWMERTLELHISSLQLMRIQSELIITEKKRYCEIL